MGSPLDGRPSIPPTTARPTTEQARATAARERAAGRSVLELMALLEIEVADKLNSRERTRLADLLAARAAEFHGLGRAIAESGDIEAMARLDPVRGARLVTARAVAATAAGNAWKAIGARAEAQAAFTRATSLGGAAPGDLGLRPTRPPPPPASPTPAELDAWLLAGASLSARLLPLAAASPALLDGSARSLAWAELLLGEDPTSPDVREAVAIIFGHAGRFGGTDQMLMELTYHSPDRAAGLARGAVVWERVGRPRDACAQWIRAARWRDDPGDPAWQRAIACARRDPGAADWREIRDYVLARARPEQREAVAAALDGRPTPGDGGVAAEAGAGAAAGADAGAGTAAGAAARADAGAGER